MFSESGCIIDAEMKQSSLAHRHWPEEQNGALITGRILDVAPASIRDSNQNGVRWQMTQNRANAGRRGLDLVAYEGGQHLVGTGEALNNQQLAALFIAANRHPRMRELYLEYLNQWREVGGGLFNHWNDVYPYNMFGSWGAIEYQNQDPATAPKYQALMEFISLNGR
jgi:hypothetical protein